MEQLKETPLLREERIDSRMSCHVQIDRNALGFPSQEEILPPNDGPQDDGLQDEEKARGDGFRGFRGGDIVRPL